MSHISPCFGFHDHPIKLGGLSIKLGGYGTMRGFEALGAANYR
jgi:hypothetical protein